MRRGYKVLTSIILTVMLIGLFVFSTINATQIGAAHCDSYPNWEYWSQGDCPKLKSDCPTNPYYHPIYSYCPEKQTE